MAESDNKQVASVYSDFNVHTLVSKFLNGQISVLEPVYSPLKGYSYPVVEEILEDKAKVPMFLEKLVDMGLLEKKIFDKTLTCPNCGSEHLNFRYCCPFCKSFNIKKSSLIEHIKCGYMDIESKFQQKDKLVCPKCNQELKKPDVDYRKAGVWCSCKDCNKSFDIPVTEHFCKDCHEVSTFEEAIINDVYAYTLKANIKADSSLNWYLSSAVSSLLVKQGLKVEASAVVKGKSGANHTFDIVAYKDKDSKKTVIDIATAETSVSEQPIIALFAKIFDVTPERAFLIAVPKINDNAKKMAELYNIRAIEAKNPDEAVAVLKTELGQA
jgi:transcription elongation factor Elf1